MDTMNNKTYWDILGFYAYNTLPQPYWCMGYDIQGVNLTDPAHM